MSDLIKQLETIGQNAQQRYRQQKLEMAQLNQLNQLNDNQQKAFLVVPNQ